MQSLLRLHKNHIQRLLKQFGFNQLSFEKFKTTLTIDDFRFNDDSIKIEMLVHSPLIFFKPNLKLHITVTNFLANEKWLSAQIIPLVSSENHFLFRLYENLSARTGKRITLNPYLSLEGSNLIFQYQSFLTDKIGFCPFTLEGISVFDESIHVVLS